MDVFEKLENKFLVCASVLVGIAVVVFIMTRNKEHFKKSLVAANFVGAGQEIGTQGKRFFTMKIESIEDVYYEIASIDQKNVSKSIRIFYDYNSEKPIGVKYIDNWVYPVLFNKDKVTLNNLNYLDITSDAMIIMNKPKKAGYKFVLMFVKSIPVDKNNKLPKDNVVESVKWILRNRPQKLLLAFAVFANKKLPLLTQYVTAEVTYN